MTFSFSLVAIHQVVNNAPNMYTCWPGNLIFRYVRGRTDPLHQLGARILMQRRIFTRAAGPESLRAGDATRWKKVLLKTAVPRHNPVLVLEADCCTAPKEWSNRPMKKLLIPLAKGGRKARGQRCLVIC